MYSFTGGSQSGGMSCVPVFNYWIPYFVQIEGSLCTRLSAEVRRNKRGKSKKKTRMEWITVKKRSIKWFGGFDKARENRVTKKERHHSVLVMQGTEHVQQALAAKRLILPGRYGFESHRAAHCSPRDAIREIRVQAYWIGSNFARPTAPTLCDHW